MPEEQPANERADEFKDWLRQCRRACCRRLPLARPAPAQNSELVQRMLKIVHERVPFAAGYFHLFVRLVHGAACVLLG